MSSFPEISDSNPQSNRCLNQADCHAKRDENVGIKKKIFSLAESVLTSYLMRFCNIICHDSNVFMWTNDVCGENGCGRVHHQVIFD